MAEAWLHLRVKYLIGSLKPRDSICNLLPQTLRMLTCILLQTFSNSFDFVNGPGNIPPSIVLEHRITLTVDTEVSVVLPLNEPVSSLVSISSPWLDGQWLIEVIVMSGLFV